MAFVLRNIRDMMREQIKDKKKYKILDSVKTNDDIIEDSINEQVKAIQVLPDKGRPSRR